MLIKQQLAEKFGYCEVNLIGVVKQVLDSDAEGIKQALAAMTHPDIAIYLQQPQLILPPSYSA